MFKSMLDARLLKVLIFVFAFSGYFACSLHIFPEIDHNHTNDKHNAQEHTTNCFSHNVAISNLSTKITDYDCNFTLQDGFSEKFKLLNTKQTFYYKKDPQLKSKIPVYLKNNILLI